ncbi:MAG TPA: hypothetical protein VEC12_03445 [Bacteroidia bacterium]|nr:hypothetical protein [Bacteroidia bacterium]
MCNYNLSSQINNPDSVNNLLNNNNTYKVNGSKKDSLKKNNPVSFHGTIITEAQTATKSYQYQQVPQNYIRWTIQPELTLFGLPFKSLINLTTEQGKVNYNLNRFNLSLDVNRFQKTLINRLKERAKDSVNQNLFDRKKWEDSLKGTTLVNDQINSLKKRATEDSLELVKLKEKLPSTKDGIPDSLTANNIKYREKYEAYKDKKTEYEKHQKTLDSLMALKEKYQELQNQYESLKKSGVFDSDAIRQYAGSKFPEKYKNHPYISKGQRFLLSIRNFSVGTVYSNTSSPYNQGAAVKGIAVENGFGKIYTYLSAGLLEQQLNFGALKQSRTPVYIYTAKAGYGMPENTHLHLGISKTGYVGRSKPQKEEETLIKTSEPGAIYDVDGRINLNQNIWVSGYWAIAENSQNHFYKSSELPQTNNKYGFSELIDRPNTTWSANATGTFNKDKTRIIAQVLRVGTGFNSLANPFMRKDLFRQEVKLTQKLYKSFISVSAFYRKDRDNLLGQKQYTTELDNYKASLNIRLKKLPSFILSYNRIEQLTGNNSFRISTVTGIYSLTTIYNKRIKDKTLTSSLTLLHQRMDISVSETERNFSSAVVSLGIVNQKGNGVNYTSVTNISSGLVRNIVVNNQLEGFYTWPKNAAFATTGGVYHTADNFWGNSGGAFIKQTLSFWKKSMVAVCLRENLFRQTYNNAIYFQTIVNVQLIQQW